MDSLTKARRELSPYVIILTLLLGLIFNPSGLNLIHPKLFFERLTNGVCKRPLIFFENDSYELKFEEYFFSDEYAPLDNFPESTYIRFDISDRKATFHIEV